MELKETYLDFIQNNLLTSDEIRLQTKIFNAFDTDYCGTITDLELIKGMTIMKVLNPDKSGMAVFAIFDKDGNGHINFKEWCNAMINKRELVTDDRLKMVFEEYDKDGSGTMDG